MAKKRVTEFIRIDYERLKEAVDNHGYSLIGLASELGFGHSYFSSLRESGKMPVRSAKLLETVGIHQHEYEWVEPEIPEEPEDPPLPWDIPVETPMTAGTLTVRLDEDQMAQLGVMIREQVYEAVKKAWAE